LNPHPNLRNLTFVKTAPASWCTPIWTFSSVPDSYSQDHKLKPPRHGE
jgi:hypothetical protein